MFLQVDFHENPNIGVYCRVNDNIGFVRKGLSKKIMRNIAKILEIDLIELSIADTSIIGSLMVLNSHGVVVTDLVDQSNINLINSMGLDIFVVSDVLNAAGNDILINDFGGLVHPDMDPEMIIEMEDILKIPIKKGTIAGLKTVGMAAVATNKGVLCHPKVSEEEKIMISSVFQVPIMIGTINHGTPLIGSGLIANTKGFVVGTLTTGIEMGRIEEALGFLDSNMRE